MIRRRCHFVRATRFCAVLVISATAFPVHADELDEARKRLDDVYRSELAELSEEVATGGDGALAQRIRDWLPPSHGRFVVFDPNDATPETLPTDVGFAALRTSQADALFDLAKRAAGAGRAALAFQLASETVRENPDHANARRMLGFEPVDGRWLTLYSARQQNRGYVWHESFGWIKTKDVARYEAGQRPKGRRWISAEEDAKRRTAIDDGWIVRTTHFLVTTNHSLEGGVRLANRLESLHSLWRQLFAGYYLSKREVRELFTGERSPRRQPKPYRVRYYRSRDGYIKELAPKQPQIAKTLGIYFAKDRLSHFFAGEDQHPATIVHEATHQFFQESGRSVRNVGALDNFWIVEGVATYMESLEEKGGRVRGQGSEVGGQGSVAASQSKIGRGGRLAGRGTVESDLSEGTGDRSGDNHQDFRYFTIGDSKAGRVPAARERWLGDRYYVPFAELVRLGKDDLQRRSDLAKLYGQIAGQTTFLMHAQDGRYRNALVDYLVAVYAGRADANTLGELTGQSYAELDREYHAWLEALR